MGLRGARARPYSHRLDMTGVRAKELLELAQNPPKPKKWRLPWMKKGLSRSQRVIVFCQDLTVTSGTEAGEKLRLRYWQKEDIEAIYEPGKDGKRLVRTAVVSMGRKNGKTQLAAALALCHLCGPEAESRGEVYSCANDRFQASKI